MHRTALVRNLLTGAFALCLVVVVLGAYVRVSAAGLGCPDWPGCYGHLSPAADALDPSKAWKEMVHRYAVAALCVLVAAIAVLAFTWRRERLLSLPLALTLVACITLQAVLGALTVTQQLQPLIVTSHLLFGLTTLSQLWWMLQSATRRKGGAWGAQSSFYGKSVVTARRAALLGLLALIVQIALGGWTSSHYAATACPDFPTCQNAWWPTADFRAAFTLWLQGSIFLPLPALIAIHFVHRLGAVVASAALIFASIAVFRLRSDVLARRAAAFVLVALVIQLTLGITMVKLGFPLWIATAHNAGAVLLLLSTLALNSALRPA
jgi:cytochrome c oxidase assembly protein subunit 15